MNPIGDVKGFILDVMKNIAIVFGVGYMGGSLVALTHLDAPTIDKMLPIDLHQAPYVGKKSGFSFTGYAFPYTLYTPHATFYPKVINWLVMTAALVFIGIRKLFRKIASIPDKWFYHLPLFYLGPVVLLCLWFSSTSVLITLVACYSIFIGDFILEEDRMKNGIWYFLAPVSFFYNSFVGPVEPGIINFMLRLFISFLAGTLGFFAMTLFYPLCWSTIVAFGSLYYILFLLLSPLWYGFKKVIIEMGNYRMSLTLLFMLLTIWSSQSFLVALFTSGIVVGSIYMFYFLFKNKFKK